MIINVMKLDENGQWINIPMTIEEWIKSTIDLFPNRMDGDK